MAKHLGSLIVEKNLTVQEILQIASLTTPGQVLTITDSSGTVDAIDIPTLNRVVINLANLGSGTLVGDFNIQTPPVTITENDLVVINWAFNGASYLFMGANGSYGNGAPDTAIISDFYQLGSTAGGGNEFVDNVFRILSDDNTTKEIAFSAASIAPNTTRTIIMPNYDVDLGNLLQPPQTGVASPVGTVTPRYAGDLYVNTTANTSWIANSTSSFSWERADNVKSVEVAADPTAGNDSTQGYEPLSLWLNSNTNDLWVCKSATVGAAVWVNVNSGSGTSVIYDVNQVGHGLLVDQPIALADGSTLYVPASANDDTLIAIGIVVEVVDVDNFKFQSSGMATYQAGGLVPGRAYYLGQTPGTITDLVLDNYSQPLFTAQTATTILIGIDPMAVYENLGDEFMLKAVYDPDDNGIVNNSEALNGRPDTDFEDNLGLPAADGDILSSTIAGVRSWITNPGGATTENITASVTVGGILDGDVVPSGTSLNDFVKALIAPTVNPTKTNNSVVLNGVTTSTLEVGSTYTTNLVSVYSTGTIFSADGSPDVPLTGPATTEVFSGPGVVPGGAVSTIIIAGNNQWGVNQDFSAETAPYYDSEGNVSTIFDADRGPGTINTNSNIVTGKYRWWWAVGSIPTTSAGVRALPNTGFYPTAAFDITIPANTTQVAFYLPDSFTSVAVQYVQSSFADVTGTFTQFPMIVDDAGGTTINYIRFQATIGGTGYPSTATYRVLITT